MKIFSKDHIIRMKTLTITIISLFLFVSAPHHGLASESVIQTDPALELIQSLGCKGCHKIKGDGGSLAPDLTQIGSRMTAEQIHNHLVAPSDTRTKGFMPSYSTLTENDLNLITQYLYNLR